jgi:hypothetical protein
MKFLFLFFVFTVFADENKNITLIQVKDTTETKTTIQRELLDECISLVANPDDLEAVTTMKTYYLKGIGGDNTKNDWVKDYTATIEVPYIVEQRKLILVTQDAPVNPKEPTFKEVKKRFQKTKTFTSDSSNGNLFGGRSNRRYLFSKKELAIDDVKLRAKTWITMQQTVMCQE